jgi:CBS domain containing-hemolysin-like protein
MLIFVTAVTIVLVVSFLCSIFEAVLLSLSRPQVEVMVEQDKRAGHLLSRFKDNMDVPIAAILILNTAAHTIGAAVAGASYTSIFDVGTLWVFSIIFTLAVLLFTEIIPKTLGVTYASSLAAPVAHGIQFLTTLLRPLVAVSEKISRSLRRGKEIPVTTVEEIRLLASLGRQKGVVGSATAGMIVGAAQLRHLHAHDVMLPRDEVKFLSAAMNRDEAMTLVRESGHSRFPFSQTRDLDDFAGVVLAKDLLHWLLQNEEADVDWESLMKEPLVVPRSAPLMQLLRTFQDSQRHLAIVVNEYGSVDGIATLEDVLEEIVGDIFDETDLPIAEFQETASGDLIVRAHVDLRKLCARLDVAWDPETEPATIGGLVTETIERIPVAGDFISWNGYRIEVLRADQRHAKLLRIYKE